MDRSSRNKENQPTGISKTISSYYKVSKRLFESNKPDNFSPISNMIQPSSPAWGQADSPYLYEYNKKQFAPNKLIKETTECSTMNETPLKRSGVSIKQRIALTCNVMEVSDDDDDDERMQCSPSSVTMEVVERVMSWEEEATLSGDFSQECLLPVIKGKHPELRTINAELLASLLNSVHGYDVTIIDCRYPYEYSAGHIKNAINLYYKGNVEENFFSRAVTRMLKNGKILIFYCEFSSERAPSMMRYIRNKDRKLNDYRYPLVFYPEMYLLDGGYKSFYGSFKELCDPQNYKPMLAKENTTDFVYYRNRCKSFDQKSHKECENR